MNLKSLLISTVGLTTINSIVPSLLNHSQQLKDGNDTISQIAQKYESSTIDISTINYQNFYHDITNSSIKQSLAKAVTPTFQISETNSWSTDYIWYNNYGSGATSQHAYEAKITSDTINILSNLAMITLISKIAHYYGDNTTIDSHIRIAAIVKDLDIMDEFVNNINNNALPLDKNGNFAQKISNWKNNIGGIINDAITKNYSNDQLLADYNSINFDDLATYHGNMHNCDDWCIGKIWNQESWDKVNKSIGDWFSIGTTSNNDLFKVSLSNNLTYWWEDFGLWHLYEYSYSDPTNYDINI